MARLLIPILLFGLLIYWAFGTSLRDRYALELRRYKWVSTIILVIALVVFGVLVARAPILRTPVGMAFAAPLLFALHATIASSVARYLRLHGWLTGPDGARIVTVDSGRPGFWEQAFSKYFYVSLTVAYLVTISIILVINHLIKS